MRRANRDRRDRVAERSQRRRVGGAALLATTHEPDFSASIRDLRVEVRPVSALKPARRNPRTHSKKQLRQLADSIRIFGWTNPVMVDGEGGVIAGHGRLEAAKLLGLECVPTIRIQDMTEEQRRAYVLADNKLAENAGWDRKVIATELRDLLAMDLEFEITTTGFDMGEIDLLIRASDDREKR